MCCPADATCCWSTAGDRGECCPPGVPCIDGSCIPCPPGRSACHDLEGRGTSVAAMAVMCAATASAVRRQVRSAVLVSAAASCLRSTVHASLDRQREKDDEAGRHTRVAPLDRFG